MLASLVVNMRITIWGRTMEGTTKNKAPPRANKMDRPNTFLIFFTSLFPQNWAASTPLPLTMPNTSRENTKNTLFASPTAANGRSPKASDHQGVHQVHHCVQHTLQGHGTGDHQGFL